MCARAVPQNNARLPIVRSSVQSKKRDFAAFVQPAAAVVGGGGASNASHSFSLAGLPRDSPFMQMLEQRRQQRIAASNPNSPSTSPQSSPSQLSSSASAAAAASSSLFPSGRPKIRAVSQPCRRRSAAHLPNREDAAKRNRKDDSGDVAHQPSFVIVEHNNNNNSPSIIEHHQQQFDAQQQQQQQEQQIDPNTVVHRELLLPASVASFLTDAAQGALTALAGFFLFFRKTIIYFTSKIQVHSA